MKVDCIEKVLKLCDAVTLARAGCCNKCLLGLSRPILQRTKDDVTVLCESLWRAVTNCTRYIEWDDDEGAVHKQFWWHTRIVRNPEMTWENGVLDYAVFMDSNFESSYATVDIDGIEVKISFKYREVFPRVTVSVHTSKWSISGGVVTSDSKLEGLDTLITNETRPDWKLILEKRRDFLQRPQASLQERYVIDALQEALHMVRMQKHQCATCKKYLTSDSWAQYSNLVRCCSLACCNANVAPYTLPDNIIFVD